MSLEHNSKHRGSLVFWIANNGSGYGYIQPDKPIQARRKAGPLTLLPFNQRTYKNDRRRVVQAGDVVTFRFKLIKGSASAYDVNFQAVGKKNWSNATNIGTVTRLNPGEKFGFVKTEATSSAFFHLSHCSPNSTIPTVGSQVICRLIATSRGVCAYDVRPHRSQTNEHQNPNKDVAQPVAAPSPRHDKFVRAPTSFKKPASNRNSAALRTNVFRKSGTVWEIGLQGKTAHFDHLVGFSYIQMLISRSPEKVQAVEMELSQGKTRVRQTSELEPVIDARAIRESDQVLQELTEKLATASPEDYVDLKDEIAALTNAKSAVQWRGKTRMETGPAERARKNVSNAIRRAIAEVARADASVGRHLSNSLQTGNSCCYQPEHPTKWDL